MLKNINFTKSNIKGLLKSFKYRYKRFTSMIWKEHPKIGTLFSTQGDEKAKENG